MPFEGQHPHVELGLRVAGFRQWSKLDHSLKVIAGGVGIDPVLKGTAPIPAVRRPPEPVAALSLTLSDPKNEMMMIW